MKIVDRGYYGVILKNNMEDNTDSLTHRDAPKSYLVESDDNIITGNECI